MGVELYSTCSDSIFSSSILCSVMSILIVQLQHVSFLDVLWKETDACLLDTIAVIPYLFSAITKKGIQFHLLVLLEPLAARPPWQDLARPPKVAAIFPACSLRECFCCLIWCMHSSNEICEIVESSSSQKCLNLFNISTCPKITLPSNHSCIDSPTILRRELPW